MEEDWSSAHHFRNFPRQKRVVLRMWSEMYRYCVFTLWGRSSECKSRYKSNLMVKRTCNATFSNWPISTSCLLLDVEACGAVVTNLWLITKHNSATIIKFQHLNFANNRQELFFTQEQVGDFDWYKNWNFFGKKTEERGWVWGSKNTSLMFLMYNNDCLFNLTKLRYIW